MNDEDEIDAALESTMDAEGTLDMSENRNWNMRKQPIQKMHLNPEDYEPAPPEEEHAIEEANEPVAKQEREAKQSKSNEQTVRVVVDRPKAKEKEHFDEGFTPEEKAEWKHTRIEEKRATMAERKLRLTQRKRDVEDRRFKEAINVLEQSGTYRKARIVGQAVAPVRAQAQASSQASAQGRPFSMNDMVGQVQGFKRNPPYNPIVASQGRRADYFGRGHLNAGPRMGHPLTMTHSHVNYSTPRVTAVGGALHSLNKPSHFLGKGKAMKSRWKRAW